MFFQVRNEHRNIYSCRKERNKESKQICWQGQIISSPVIAVTNYIHISFLKRPIYILPWAWVKHRINWSDDWIKSHTREVAVFSICKLACRDWIHREYLSAPLLNLSMQCLSLFTIWYVNPTWRRRIDWWDEAGDETGDSGLWRRACGRYWRVRRIAGTMRRF